VFGPVKISKVPALLLFALIISELFCQAARLIPLRFTNRSSNDVGRTIGSGVGVGVGTVVGVALTLTVESGAGDGLGEVVGVSGFTATPLFQTNFFPDLIHVYFFPPEVVVVPTFLQEPPDFTAADTGVMKISEPTNMNRSGLTLIRIPNGKWAGWSFSMTRVNICKI
jgi:hypothetical protein